MSSYTSTPAQHSADDYASYFVEKIEATRWNTFLSHSTTIQKFILLPPVKTDEVSLLLFKKIKIKKSIPLLALNPIPSCCLQLSHSLQSLIHPSGFCIPHTSQQLPDFYSPFHGKSSQTSCQCSQSVFSQLQFRLQSTPILNYVLTTLLKPHLATPRGQIHLLVALLLGQSPTFDRADHSFF